MQVTAPVHAAGPSRRIIAETIGTGRPRGRPPLHVRCLIDDEMMMMIKNKYLYIKYMHVSN